MVEIGELIERILKSADGDAKKYRDVLTLIKHLEHEGEFEVGNKATKDVVYMFNDENYRAAHKWSKVLRARIREELGKKADGDMYDLYKDVLKFDAKSDFDSYCLFLEWNRPAYRKFYAPRRTVLLPLVADLQKLYDGELDFLGVSLPPRVGKLLSDDTDVLTTNGWKKHGDLVVGDYVYGLDGKPVKVTHVFPKNVANKRVWFTNGEHIDCHENHEWYVYNRHRQKYETLETKYIAEHNLSGVIGSRGSRFFYQIPLVSPIENPDIDLPVAPYTLGAWLGDGRNQSPDICGAKEDYAIVESILDEGYKMSWHTTHKTTGVEYYGFKDLRKDLQSVGMCHSRRTVPKHIPDVYFTASVKQRLELLAGLLDTDGTLVRKENRYHFATAEETLRDSFVALVSSFGWRCCVTKHDPCVSSSGIAGRRPCWSISFNPTLEIPCRLPRKQLKIFSKKRKIAIMRIEDIEPKPGNCISVEGGIYRVGRTMIPTHNSTLCIFFMSWLMGNRPTTANVMSGHSDKLTEPFFREVLNILTDDTTYLWKEVFPDVHIHSVSAKNEQIDLGTKSRFPTFTARSVGGTLTGAVEIGTGGCLYCDDLIEDREESLSPERLDNKYNAYLNQLKDRKKDGAFELMVGTRWNVLDPLGRIEQQYRDNPRYKFDVIPAVDENGHSNFNYPYNLGFSDEYYADMKASIDDAEWCAKYMGNPYIREGLLYPNESLRRFFETPDREPDAVVAVCDPAQGGGDDTFMPIFAQYGEDHYLVDCVCSPAMPEVVDGMCAEALIKNAVQLCQFEVNSGGGRAADNCEKRLKEKGGSTRITKKQTQANKETKIYINSGWIKEHVLFLDDRRIQAGSQYQRMMRLLTSYVVVGNNKTDDVPDGLAQYALYQQREVLSNRVVIARRPF